MAINSLQPGFVSLCSNTVVSDTVLQTFRFSDASSPLPTSLCFVSEKKKEKEREELWKKLEDLELKRGLRRDGIIPT